MIVAKECGRVKIMLTGISINYLGHEMATSAAALTGEFDWELTL